MDSISAGDLEKYGYCPLSWWLSRGKDVDNEALRRGVEKHREIEKKLDRAKRNLDQSKGFERAVLWSAVLATIASIAGVILVPGFSIAGDEGNGVSTGGYILAFLALVWLLAASYFLYRAEKMGSKELRNKTEIIITVFSIVAMLLALYSVTYILSPEDTKLATSVEALALMWLVGASLFLYKSLDLFRRYSGDKKRAGVKKGELEYHDSFTRKAQLLRSDKHGLTGRPDYLLKMGDDIIPVEVKTGRVPRGPLFSHILQLSAYCLLVEETYGKVPPYGVIRYGTTEHELEYTPEMKKLVLDKLKEMRERVTSNNVHRNHNRASKCRYCSRRRICPERLDQN